MNFTVSSTILLNRLQSIGRVVPTKTQLPMLDSFLLNLENGLLTITASDLETTMVTSMPVIESSGDITVAITAEFLLSTLQTFGEQPLRFDINPENLAININTESGNYNFIGQNGKEYPELPHLESETTSFVVSANSLLNGVTKTTFAVASDDLRPTMTGIFFDIKADSITYVATDAHKLVRIINTEKRNNSAEASFILPKKPAALLKTIMSKETNDVEISFDKKNITFQLSDYKLICRQIEGRFPNYNGVIPTQNPFKITIDRLSLLGALRRVAAFSNRGTGLVKMNFAPNAINLTAQDIDFSTAAQEKIACNYDGDEINIGFKAPFLQDILSNISSEMVVIELADPSRPGIILPFENEQDEEVLMLIMPMLVSD